MTKIDKAVDACAAVRCLAEDIAQKGLHSPAEKDGGAHKAIIGIVDMASFLISESTDGCVVAWSLSYIHTRTGKCSPLGYTGNNRCICLSHFIIIIIITMEIGPSEKNIEVLFSKVSRPGSTSTWFPFFLLLARSSRKLQLEFDSYGVRYELAHLAYD